MKKIYDKIWELAKPYYEKGRPTDIDHIKLMIKDASLLCEKEGIDDSVLLPLVILHDVGYGVGKHVYLEKELKGEHMRSGAKIAREIMEKVGYPEDKIKRIQGYVLVHDNWIFGENDIYHKDLILGVFTDLDYMWMSTPKGFPVIMKILGKNKKETIKYLETNEKLESRPFSCETTREMNEQYLNDRRNGV